LPPVVEEKLNVEDPEPPWVSVIVDGFIDVEGPDGLLDADSVIVPENPPRLCNEIVAVPDWPAFSAKLDALEDREKSTT
jgi:hypothetical protein